MYNTYITVRFPVVKFQSKFLIHKKSHSPVDEELSSFLFGVSFLPLPVFSPLKVKASEFKVTGGRTTGLGFLSPGRRAFEPVGGNNGGGGDRVRIICPPDEKFNPELIVKTSWCEFGALLGLCRSDFDVDVGDDREEEVMVMDETGALRPDSGRLCGDKSGL